MHKQTNQEAVAAPRPAPTKRVGQEGHVGRPRGGAPPAPLHHQPQREQRAAVERGAGLCRQRGEGGAGGGVGQGAGAVEEQAGGQAEDGLWGCGRGGGEGEAGGGGGWGDGRQGRGGRHCHVILPRSPPLPLPPRRAPIGGCGRRTAGRDGRRGDQAPGVGGVGRDLGEGAALWWGGGGGKGGGWAGINAARQPGACSRRAGDARGATTAQARQCMRWSMSRRNSTINSMLYPPAAAPTPSARPC